MRWIKRKGMSAYLSEIPYYGNPTSAEPEMQWWNCSRQSIYAAAKSMWDTSTSAINLVSDWSNKVYGPAGADMNNYYWDMDSAWRAGTSTITGFLKTPEKYLDGFTSSALFHKSYKRFADAFEKIANDSNLTQTQKNRIESQILLERELLDNWMDIFQADTGRTTRYYTTILPRTNGNNLTTLPGLEISFNQLSTSITKISAGWTSGNLHLRITPPEQSQVINTTLTRDDAASFAQGYEIYVQPDSTRPEFYRVRIHPEQGKYSDASTYSGITYNSSWNPVASIWVGTNSNDSLVINVQLSFTSMGMSGADGKKFKLGIRRKSSSGTYTGWPEAQSNYIGLFSMVKLVEEPEIDPNMVKKNTAMPSSNSNHERPQTIQVAGLR
jgi:hypothetical protein